MEAVDMESVHGNVSAPAPWAMGVFKCAMEEIAFVPGNVSSSDVPSDGAELDGANWQGRLYKVPEDQRRANPQAYEPYMFYFGPYRFVTTDRDQYGKANDPSSTQTGVEGDHFKRQGASKFQDANETLAHLAEEIDRNYPKLEAIYAQLDPNQWQQLVKQQLVVKEGMALDAFATVAAAVSPSRFFAAYPIGRLLFSDALLLENQIPLELLRSAFKSLQFDGSFEEEVVSKYCKYCNPFPQFKPSSLMVQPAGMQVRRRNYIHDDCLLGVIYDCLTPINSDSKPAAAQQLQPAAGRQSDDDDDDDALLQFRPSPAEVHKPSSALLTASYLARCGIRCRPVPAPLMGTASFDGISFHQKDKVLELPTILVGDNTMRFLHNLLAYEATCRYPEQSYVISYCHFMDRLIDTAEDVEVLVKAKVIQNFMGSGDELAAAWNRLCNSVSYRTSRKEHINRIISEVEQHAKKRWRRWRAAFKETYWDKQPWLLISILAATVLLVLTILQTIYTMKSA